MKVSSALALLAVVAPATANETNPLAKVVDLLDDLSGRVSADGEKADKAYGEYFEWCGDVDKNVRNEIKRGKASKDKLEASIAKLTANIEVATSKIEDLAASVADAEKELKQATIVRKKEAGQFAAAEAQLVDAVDTLGRAIAVLDREMEKNPAAFAQIDTGNMQRMLSGLGAVIDAAAFSASDRSKLVALVQASSGDDDDDDDDDAGTPAPSAYKSHSSDILDVLGDMKDKAAGELSELRQTEATAKHSFEMLKGSLERQIAADTNDLKEQQSGKEADAEQKGIDAGDLVVTKKQLAVSEDALKHAHHECISLAADHERSMASRKEELKVLAEAKTMLKDTTSGAEEKTYSFLQVSSGAQKKFKVSGFIRHLAKQEHSAALAQLASRVGALVQYSHGADVFGKVKGLINDMIAKLEREAAADAQEKAYCDEEMAKTAAKKAELEDTIDSLTTKIDQAAAKSVELKGDVKTLQAELAALARLQLEMDKIRQEQHAAYSETKADLEKGLSGVQNALELLRGYYGGAALVQSEASFGAFMQQPAKPEMHSRSLGAGGSIIGILEVIENDFSKNLAETEQEESDAVSEFEKTTQANEVSKTIKEQAVKHNTAEFKSLDNSVAELGGDKDTSLTQLDAVEEYFSQIKARCAKPGSYEARVKRRTAEIQGLKQALSILDDTAFLQRRSLRQSHLRA